MLRSRFYGSMTQEFLHRLLINMSIDGPERSNVRARPFNSGIEGLLDILERFSVLAVNQI